MLPVEIGLQSLRVTG
jgi:hypothetical protein